MARTPTPADLAEATVPDIDLALVAIGVDFYPESTIPSLSCAANDAEEMCALLTSRRLRTDADLLVNEQATIDEIRNAVVSAARKVHKNGTLLLTFSGHGAPILVSANPECWEAAFLTHEFNSFSQLNFGPNRNSLTGAFTLQDVKQWLNEAEVMPGKNEKGIRPANIVVVMDSCGSGASIVHDGTGADDVSADGRNAVARRFVGEDAEILKAAGATLDHSVRLDNSQAPWPSGSQIVAISAATRGGVAHEIPDIGHGFLSLLVLEWFSKGFLTKPDGVTDLGREMYDYIKQEAHRLEVEAGPKGEDLQRPAKSDDGEVEISNKDCLVRIPVENSLLSIGRLMPVPEPTGNPETFERNVSRLAEEVTRDIDEVNRPGDANCVVQFPRFSNTRALLQSTVDRVAKKVGANRPTIFLGMGRIRRIVPLIGSLEAAFESLPGQQANVAAGLPVVAGCLPSLVHNYVDRLKENRACVIAPFRQEECDELMTRFLRRCASEPRIRLVLALFADEPVPEWANEVHYRLVDLKTPPREPLEDRMRQLGISDLSAVPEVFFNETVLHWLEALRRRENDERTWQVDFCNYSLPAFQGGNGTRAILNVLKALLLTLKDESPNLLSLLKAMGAISLPRCERLVGHLWGRLEEGNMIVEANSNGLDDALTTMLNHRLISKSAQRDDWRQPCPPHYFVHSLVRSAAREHERKYHTDDYVKRRELWRGFAGRAIHDLLQDPRFDEWWPRSVLAHEAIRHLLAARRPKDACQVLSENWSELVDSGYHEVMLDWCRTLYADIVPASLDDEKVLESLELLIPLVRHQQTLHRHRQEWEVIKELHSQIKRRTGKFRPKVEDDDPEPIPELNHSGLEQCYWKSRHNIGNLHFIHKDFRKAKDEYEACYQWSGRGGGDLDIQIGSMIRLANCHVLEGDFPDADEKMQEVETLISDSGAKAARHRRHLRSVRIEEARIMEDHQYLYDLAVAAWTDTLQSCASKGGCERLDSAISNIQMGWASLVRGEFLRAWRHALQARRFLNDRGIPEHWWYCATEQVAALAIAYMFRCMRQPESEYTPWYRQTFVHPDAAGNLFTEDVLERQCHSLEKLIRIGLYPNPWLAAELMSALGELQIHAQRQHQAGKRQLFEALRLAGDEKHQFLEARIHEALGTLYADPGANYHFGKCYEIVKAMGVAKATERCKSNWDSSRRHRTQVPSSPNT